MSSARRRADEFRFASREEVWAGASRIESRTSYGVARRTGSRIVAADERDDELLALAVAACEARREAIAPDARVRIVATSRRVRESVRTEAVTTVTIGGFAAVNCKAARLRSLIEIPRSIDRTDLPIVWHGGSAAVLLHEAVGHPAEHLAQRLEWPHWLSVADVPPFAIDDEGKPIRQANLLVEPPSAARRESFRDVPLKRMTHLVATQNGAPFDIPERVIDVYLTAGGSYDPLTDDVIVHVAVSSAGPFTYRRQRSAIPSLLAGATGAPLEYPGVICSREGQELFVGSSAPVMVTR